MTTRRRRLPDAAALRAPARKGQRPRDVTASAEQVGAAHDVQIAGVATGPASAMAWDAVLGVGGSRDGHVPCVSWPSACSCAVFGRWGRVATGGRKVTNARQLGQQPDFLARSMAV